MVALSSLFLLRSKTGAFFRSRLAGLPAQTSTCRQPSRWQPLLVSAPCSSSSKRAGAAAHIVVAEAVEEEEEEEEEKEEERGEKESPGPLPPSGPPQ